MFLLKLEEVRSIGTWSASWLMGSWTGMCVGALRLHWGRWVSEWSPGSGPPPG